MNLIPAPYGIKAVTLKDSTRLTHVISKVAEVTQYGVTIYDEKDGPVFFYAEAIRHVELREPVIEAKIKEATGDARLFGM